MQFRRRFVEFRLHLLDSFSHIIGISVIFFIDHVQLRLGVAFKDIFTYAKGFLEIFLELIIFRLFNLISNDVSADEALFCLAKH